MPKGHYPRKRKVIRTTRYRNRAKPASDKFIVGMVAQKEGGESRLSMFQNPEVFDTYAKALADAEKRYHQYPGCKFVVFAKVCTIGAPRLAPKVEEFIHA